MEQTALILYIIKLALGGLTAFFAILVWSKTREGAWISLVAGVIVRYAGIVYDMLLDFGVVFAMEIQVAGIPLTTLLFTVVPSLFFILAFILMLVKNRGGAKLKHNILFTEIACYTREIREGSVVKLKKRVILKRY